MEHFQTQAGHTLAFHTAGRPSSPPVVFLGSIGSTHEMWRKVAPLVAERMMVIAPDMRGHGASDTPEGPYSMEDLAGDVLSLLDRLGIERANLVGLSIGGQTALQIALTHPQRVRRLVVSNTAAKIGTAEAWLERARIVESEGLAARASGVIRQWLTSDHARRHPEEAEELMRMITATDPRGYAGCCHALGDFDATQQLESISAPLLGIGGEQDGLTPPELVRHITEDVPDGRFVTVPGAHVPAYEAPESYAEAVLGHLTGIDEGGDQ